MGRISPTRAQSTTKGPDHPVLPAQGSHLPDNHLWSPKDARIPTPRTCENVQLHGQGVVRLSMELNLLVFRR